MAEVLLLLGIGVLTCCLILTIVVLCVVSGLFEHIEISTGKPPLGKCVIAYKFATGPYKESGSMFTELANLVPSSIKTVGIYYDDPKVVEPQDLRYAVGAVLSENDSPQDEDLKEKLVQEGYKIFNLPEVSYAVKTKFPYKTSLSILIAVARVYPQLGNYIKEHKLCAHPFLEICNGSMIEYMGPLAKQIEFYVDEAIKKGDANEGGDDDEDEDEDEGSLLSEVSRDTSYMVDGDESQSEDEEEEMEGEVIQESSKQEIDIKELPKMEKNPVMEQEGQNKDGDNSTQEVLSSASGSNLQDSGFNSEQANTPQQSLLKPEENLNASDGNESGSSFEEISADTENIPTN